MDEDDRKHLLSALRATVASQKGGVELQVLNSDYRELEGQNIPFRVLGFPTLEAYIRSLSNDFSIVPKQGSLYVMAKKNEALAHLQDLISGQNNKKKTTKKPAYKSSRGKFTGYNTSFNNRSYQHKSAPVTGSNSYGRVTNSTYRNSGSKPARAGSSSYHDRYQAHDSGYSAPARQASPVRKKSPPRAPERSEAATSASRRREPARHEPARHEPARHEPARHEPVTQEKHRNLDERQQEKRVPPTIKKMPAPLLPSPSSYPSQPIPRLLSQLQSQKEDNANHLSKNSNYTAPENLKITLRNDLCVSVPAGLERLQKPPPPLPPPHLYTSPRMDLGYHQLPMQSTIATPSLPSPLPSPSLSLHNGASSSKSSTPEVYEEPPVGSTPEEKLAHLSKYLFNEEPDVHIKHRQPDPRRKTFAYYAYVQVGSQPRISTLPNEYSTKEEARKSVVLLASNQLNKLKDERMAKALKKTTEKLNILIDRIYSLVRPSNNGLVATTVEELYEKKYEETMPPNWTTFPEVLSHPRLEVSSNAMCTIIYAKTLNTPPVAGPLRIVSDYRALEDFVSAVSIQSTDDKKVREKIMKEQQEIQKLQNFTQLLYSKSTKSSLKNTGEIDSENHDTSNLHETVKKLSEEIETNYEIEKYAYDPSVPLSEIFKNYGNRERKKTKKVKENIVNKAISCDESTVLPEESGFKDLWKKLIDEDKTHDRPVICAKKQSERNREHAEIDTKTTGTNPEPTASKTSSRATIWKALKAKLTANNEPQTVENDMHTLAAVSDSVGQSSEITRPCDYKEIDSVWKDNYAAEPIVNDISIGSDNCSNHLSTVAANTRTDDDDGDSRQTKTISIESSDNLVKEKSSVQAQEHIDIAHENTKARSPDMSCLLSRLNIESDSDWEDSYDSESLEISDGNSVWRKGAFPVTTDTCTDINPDKTESQSSVEWYHVTARMDRSNKVWSDASTLMDRSSNVWSDVTANTDGLSKVWCDVSVITNGSSDGASKTINAENDSYSRNLFKRKSPAFSSPKSQPSSQHSTCGSSTSSGQGLNYRRPRHSYRANHQ